MTELNPHQIVEALNQHVVGQASAKKAVAIALANRSRRQKTPHSIRKEISPKNILMMGPTGVGKTEIARRISALTHAPFIKVEATKFTEVGYVGRDVESIVRDLIDIAYKMQRDKAIAATRHEAKIAAEKIIIETLYPIKKNSKGKKSDHKPEDRDTYFKQLREGKLDSKPIEINITNSLGIEIMAPAGMEEMSYQIEGLLQNLSTDKGKTKKMTVKEARKALEDEEAEKLLNEDKIKLQAITNTEQNGIVFLDEIDKVIRHSSSQGEVSREGVQRDLLPLLEGTTVVTKYGSISTDHILFIASGAFMGVTPSDMISELQGRLPIRVEMLPLNQKDFELILTEPTASLIDQYQALLATEKVSLNFTPKGIARIAEISFHCNKTSDNIGARRLHTVLEKLLADISFNAHQHAHQTIKIDDTYVNDQLKTIIQSDDLSKWIL
ncbi:MAG TPA: ATP-dependent protease ATPase subunit HslU [Gammaproteobacteria bacterium]|nr:ATP-dependent protease ATPase subunit HslU [Gammaproteobacteria bacterium]